MLIPNRNKEHTNEIKKPTLPLIILASICVIGTIGYKILWAEYNATWMEAFYMTFITISTTGYREVHPVNNQVMIFTVIVSTLGISSLFYMFSILMENLFIYQFSETSILKRRLKVVNGMNDHIILVGLGRVGRIVAEELEASGEQFVIIDNDLKSSKETIEKHSWLAFEADASDNEVLKLAGIERAKSIIVATSNPAITVFVVLSARELNKSIFIVARADEDNAISKLEIAGANRIINPYSTGGHRLASIALNQHVIDFIDTTFSTKSVSLKIERYRLDEKTKHNNEPLKDLDIRKHTGVTVIGIIRGDDILLSPDANTQVRANDELVAIGTKEQLIKFNNFLND